MTKKEKLTIFVVGSAILCFFFIMFTRSSITLTLEQNQFLAFHTLLEFFSITVAMAIAFQGWIAFPQALTRQRLRVATTFLAVACLDLLHTLTYKNMPGIVFADSSVQLATSFWLAARLTQSLFLLLSFTLPDGPLQKGEHLLAFTVPLVYVVLVSSLIINYADVFPPLVIEGTGTTALKNGIEYIISSLNVVTVFVLIHQYKKQRHAPTLDVITGLSFLLFSELVFTLYRNVYDVLNVLGHVYKIAGYAYFLRGIYLATFKEPFQARERAERALAQSKEQLKHQALHDELTSLPNRRYFIETLRTQLQRAKEQHKPLAVFFLDVDNFKNINDSLGHAVGDALLKDVAKRLTICSDCFVARLGGDEFSIIVANDMPLEQLARDVIKALNEPFLYEQKQLFVTTSIGISLYPYDGDDEMTLIRHADMAMYEAKKKGKNQFAFYNDSLQEERMRRSTIGQLLYSALDNGEIAVYYQPIIDIKQKRVVGIEALARWTSKRLGFIPPNEFIAVAEENGLIIPLGEYILKTAVSHLKKLHEIGLTDLYVSVNLSLRQLYDKQFVQFVTELVRAEKIPPETIELEITETIALSDEKRVIDAILQLKQMGVRIAIDDFGSGYSSIGYLRQITVDTLKIDKSFILEVVTNKNTAKLTEAIIAFAHQLQLRVVAEGVETPDHLSFLEANRCDKVQGYLFSRPIPFHMFIEQLQKKQLLEV